MLPFYHDPHFTFRFAEDRITENQGDRVQPTVQFFKHPFDEEARALRRECCFPGSDLSVDAQMCKPAA